MKTKEIEVANVDIITLLRKNILDADDVYLEDAASLSVEETSPLVGPIRYYALKAIFALYALILFLFLLGLSYSLAAITEFGIWPILVIVFHLLFIDRSTVRCSMEGDELAFIMAFIMNSLIIGFRLFQSVLPALVIFCSARGDPLGPLDYATRL